MSGDNLEKSSNLFKWLQGLIGLIAVILSLGISWGITTSKLSALSEQIDKLEVKVDNLEEAQNGRIEKLDASVLELQLKQAAGEQILININDNVSEIKSKVEKLSEKLGR